MMAAMKGDPFLKREKSEQCKWLLLEHAWIRRQVSCSFIISRAMCVNAELPS